MRREWRWLLAAIASLAIGATCAESYSRLATPYYLVVTELVARLHPWLVESITVTSDASDHGVVLKLVGEVRRNRADPLPTALVVNRVQVGEVVEAPVVFWTLLLVWPAGSWRQRLLRVTVGIPIFLGLEAATTGCQLVYSMARVSALLAGESHPLTLWERWSRFLEAGGRFVLEVAAGLLAVALTEAVIAVRSGHRLAKQRVSARSFWVSGNA
jgi:hypothetical protein